MTFKLTAGWKARLLRNGFGVLPKQARLRACRRAWSEINEHFQPYAESRSRWIDLRPDLDLLRSDGVRSLARIALAIANNVLGKEVTVRETQISIVRTGYERF